MISEPGIRHTEALARGAELVVAEMQFRIARARREMDAARKVAPGGYGHGYEAGSLDAYTQVLDFLVERCS